MASHHFFLFFYSRPAFPTSSNFALLFPQLHLLILSPIVHHLLLFLFSFHSYPYSYMYIYMFFQDPLSRTSSSCSFSKVICSQNMVRSVRLCDTQIPIQTNRPYIEADIRHRRSRIRAGRRDERQKEKNRVQSPLTFVSPTTIHSKKIPLEYLFFYLQNVWKLQHTAV